MLIFLASRWIPIRSTGSRTTSSITDQAIIVFLNGPLLSVLEVVFRRIRKDIFDPLDECKKLKPVQRHHTQHQARFC